MACSLYGAFPSQTQKVEFRETSKLEYLDESGSDPYRDDNPDHVLTDPAIGWQTAVWVWMTSEGASYGYGPDTSHAAMTGSDGFMKAIRIINGGAGSPEADERQDRIDLYGEYTGILGTTTGAMTTSLCL